MDAIYMHTARIHARRKSFIRSSRDDNKTRVSGFSRFSGCARAPDFNPSTRRSFRDLRYRRGGRSIARNCISLIILRPPTHITASHETNDTAIKGPRIVSAINNTFYNLVFLFFLPFFFFYYLRQRNILRGAKTRYYPERKSVNKDRGMH